MNTKLLSPGSAPYYTRLFALCYLLKAACYFLFAFCLLLFASSRVYAVETTKAEEKNLRTRIALFPFENLTDEYGAVAGVMPVVRDLLEGAGFELVAEDKVDSFLNKERIRNTGYISKELADKTSKELDVNRILIGSVFSFYNSGDLQVGISARLIDSSNGLILWTDFASAAGEDFGGFLGLGGIKSMDRLITKVAGRLFSSFSTGRPFKEPGPVYRIAVMPFKSKSNNRDAGMIATNLFIVKLFRSRTFEPLEFGDVRKVIVDSRIRYRGELDNKSMESLSGALKADAFLIGTVDTYSVRTDVYLPPEVIITARLLDTQNKILWYDTFDLNGDDNIILLDWGKIRSVENVAFKLVSKIVNRMEKIEWH